ncbi:magnesium transporter [Echinococcus multilocularis]|uniref:Membrane magnesium transporter n=1 Tax=Echinococcus multilocularis TaxID=6211 RepID=A0A068YAD5_ECHMU|nr:magnesium transporter [Echinococcus multilocularis]
MRVKLVNGQCAPFICTATNYAMVELGRCLVIFGLVTLVHAAYSAIQHRTYLKLTGVHFDYLPPDIFWQTIIGLAITIAGVIRVAGDFSLINTTTDPRNSHRPSLISELRASK